MKKIFVVCALMTLSEAAVTVTIVNSNSAGEQISRFDVDGNSLDAHD